MKAVILNSGTGSRLGGITKKHPKCMTELNGGETILHRQLRLLSDAGVEEVLITTGPFAADLERHCHAAGLPLRFQFVNNPRYAETNYIYSLYLAGEAIHDDILLLHGDLVFERAVLAGLFTSPESCAVVSASLPLPEKDFKAVLRDGRIIAVGIEFFDGAVAMQPLYYLKKKDWDIWLAEIVRFCERGERGCYAENAFNAVSGDCRIIPLEIGEMLCGEVDTQEDLEQMRRRLETAGKRGM